MGNRSIPVRAIAASAVKLLAGALIATAAHADDPLAPIVNTLQGDRKKTCGDVPNGPATAQSFVYDKQLEAVAQAYARSGDAPPSPPGYLRTRYFKGRGDPQARAINSAYRAGAGQAISDCTIKHFGVGFVRNGERDVVTVAFGITAPAPAPTGRPKDTHRTKPGTSRPIGTVDPTGPDPAMQCKLEGVRCEWQMQPAVLENGECGCVRR